MQSGPFRDAKTTLELLARRISRLYAAADSGPMLDEIYVAKMEVIFALASLESAYGQYVWKCKQANSAKSDAANGVQFTTESTP